MGSNFFTLPLQTYGNLRYGGRISAEGTLERLVTDEILTPDQRDTMREFFELVSRPLPKGERKNRARKIAGMFDPVQKILEEIRADLSRE